MLSLVHGDRYTAAGGSAAALADSVELADSLDAAADAWSAIEAAGGAPTPFQSLAWHRAVESAGDLPGEPRILIGRAADGATLFVIPLALCRHGPVRSLRWLAGSQASYGAGLFHPAIAGKLGTTAALWLVDRIAALEPRADAIILADQRDDNPANPFAALARAQGAGEAYSITLGDWSALYAARMNRRARHNDRRREKRLAEIGPWQVRFATAKCDRLALMHMLFGQKRAWLRERGIDDFLADDRVRETLLALAATPCGGEVEPMVAALDVGGAIAGVSFGLVHHGRCYSLITSITADPAIQRLSPGETLFRGVLAEACARGVSGFDLGLGATQQKLDWSDIRFRTFATILPLSVEGRVFTAALRARLAAKRAIKESPVLWSLFQRARRLRGATDEAPASPEGA